MKDLPPIAWVNGTHIVLEKYIVEPSEDLCPECAQKRVEGLKKRHPEYASEIFVDGGWQGCRDSDDVASCDECGCYLSCHLTDAWIDSDTWSEAERMIWTEADWHHADGRLAAES